MGAQSWDALWADVDQGERVQVLRAEDGWRSTEQIAKSWQVTTGRASARLRQMFDAGQMERAKGRLGKMGSPGWYFRPAFSQPTKKPAKQAFA